MKCLVTGAAGLLGFETCRLLKQQGNTVWAVDNGFRSSVVPECDVWINKSLKDGLELLPLDFDVVYHLAAINGTEYFYSIPHTVLLNNLECDLLLFQWAEKCINLTSLMYASSSEVVAGSTEHGIEEKIDIVVENLHNARWSYRLPKMVAENYLANSKLPWTIIRYFNVYGEHSKSGHFVADQIDNQLNGIFKIVGADETRCFCYVTDAMQATIDLVGRAKHEVVNLGNDEEIKIIDGANIISKHLGFKNPNWNIVPGRTGSSAKRVPNISKLKSLVPNFNPRSFDTGIQEIIKLKNIHD